MPAGTDYLWEWFIRLTSTRVPGLGGMAAISELELQAFFYNRNLVPTQWELAVLIRMDKALREATSEAKQEPDAEE